MHQETSIRIVESIGSVCVTEWLENQPAGGRVYALIFRLSEAGMTIYRHGAWWQ
jgi:hypothetical protein